LFFFIYVRDNNNKTGSCGSAGFSFFQHSRDVLLFKIIKEFLGYGSIIEEKNINVIRFRVDKFSTIDEKIIPFFYCNPLLSSKIKDYLDFCKACSIIRDKSHFSNEGLKELIEIKNGMNTGRVH